jgi:hypothetical protein
MWPWEPQGSGFVRSISLVSMRFATAALFVVAALVLFAEDSLAQLRGDSPNMGVGAAVADSPSLRSRSQSRTSSWRESENERQYKETLKRIPSRKASNDPWRTVRQGAAANAVDRHQPQ